MLGVGDPLPHPPRRVVVAGVTGVGKSTLARRIAERLTLPYTEIDALFHGPGWTPREAFLADVDAFSSAPGWVTEWQYDGARPMLLERADTLVWLDHPVPLALARVVRRTIRRSRLREELWNGNVEPPLRNILWDRENIIRWAISTQWKYRRSVPAAESANPNVQFVRLRSQRAVERWLADLSKDRP